MNPDNKPYCMMKSGVNMQGTLIVPMKHLITNERNDDIYYIRMADELLRHRRVHLFMFYPEQYLNIQDQEYQILENEFLTIKSKITNDYFKQLKPHMYGKYARNIPYDNVQIA